MTDPEYSPFLKWTPTAPITIDSVAQVFNSLVSMVRDDSTFDQELLSKVSSFLRTINQNISHRLFVDDVLKKIGQKSPNPTAELSSFPKQLTLIFSKLIPRVLSIPYLRDLSVIDDRNILRDILLILSTCIQISSPDTLRSLSTTLHADPDSIRDVVLYEVLIPMEPSLVQISRNILLLLWQPECEQTLLFMSNIFDKCAFHQPTLDFICSSRIPMAFQSLLSKVEYEYTHHVIYLFMSNHIDEWKKHGTKTMRRGRILLQTLEQEGFRNHLEKTLLHDKSSEDGQCVLRSQLAFARSTSDFIPVAPMIVNTDCASHHSSFHAQTADSWIIVLHTALLMGMASSSGCASPPVDEYEQLDLHLVWKHQNRQHLVEPIKPTQLPLLSRIGRPHFRRDLARNTM
ncbi:hypothetical protein BLNAU_10165 [Blattamonas nauphoetae]|uniref:Uncharacterized protein n=1 Tax=Blattamonas nauphoetae TaxID=2049346 RepID=A0ABQ9XTP0_9EUKA|nr:hypothetical protein BLNAU_10165 [Blattamonas nauphoetae]